MAVNHFVAFSTVTTGVGVVAGAPYGCNLVDKRRSDPCGSASSTVPWARLLRRMARYMRRRAARGLIDPLEGMRDHKVYLFSGSNDWVVANSVMRAVEWQLGNLTGAASVKVNFNINSTHGWVVDGERCGPRPPGTEEAVCGECCCTPSPLLACSGHDMPGELLGHVLGRSRPACRRIPALKENLITVPQAPYTPHGRSPDDIGLWHTAYIYAPERCRTSSCAVHVHYHGCSWGAQVMGVEIIRRMGLLEWAEAAGIVIVFPQASNSLDWEGCWDWTGLTSKLFDTRRGPQLQTVMSLLSDLPRLIGSNGPAYQASEGSVLLV